MKKILLTLCLLISGLSVAHIHAADSKKMADRLLIEAFCSGLVSKMHQTTSQLAFKPLKNECTEEEAFNAEAWNKKRDELINSLMGIGEACSMRAKSLKVQSRLSGDELEIHKELVSRGDHFLKGSIYSQTGRYKALHEAANLFQSIEEKQGRN